MDQPGAAPTQVSKPDRTISTLNNSIVAIKIAKDLVPLELGKGVLSAVEGILTLVRDTIKNKDDFAELVTQCDRIGFVLRRPTSETPGHGVGGPAGRALVELQTSVNNIQESLKMQSNRRILSRMFHIAIDREQIAAWTRDLDRSLLLFNTELSITTNLKLEEISRTLRDERPAETSNIPEAIPGVPAIFFGRDQIVREVASLLTSGRHVALIGPGGMGKSCVARAVLHNHVISSKFTGHRHFVRYDDMSPSQVTLSTFLDRISRALGIKSLGVNPLSVVSSFLASHAALLVLDNAETFLDAATDAGKIADIVDELAALPGVALMLTTRTKALPVNLLCTKVSVPPLDESSALATFSAIYPDSIPSQVTRRLLGALDFHPLSINLLAQAGSQNEWSPEKLVASWEQQKADLLEIGQGKVQSLAVTIELSLNTPSLKHLRSSVIQFLQIAAFLPQGVDERKLGGLFPSLPDINMIVSKLAKQSLVYYSGKFITMLAPIRLYISSQYNAVPKSIVLLKHIREYYRDRLDRTTDVTEFLEYNSTVLDEGILDEDTNMEHLVNYDLVTSQNKLRSLSFCLAYLKNLEKVTYPHPTAIGPAILSISNSDLNKVHTGNSHFDNHFTRSQCLIYKGYCLMLLGFIARDNRQSWDTIELFLAAKEVFLSASDQRALGLCLDHLGHEYINLGQFATAEKVLEGAIQVSNDLEDHGRGASISISLAAVKTYTGKVGALELLAESQKYFWDHGNLFMAFEALHFRGLGEHYHGNYEVAKHHLEACLAYSLELEQDDTSIIECLWSLGVLALETKEYEEANKLFDERRSLSLKRGILGEASLSLAMKAVIACDQQDFDTAQRQIDLAISESSQQGNHLLAGHYPESKVAFMKAIEISDALSDVWMKAKSLRGIGELAVLERDLETAKESFSEMKSLCDFMGIAPKLLYRGLPYHKLEGFEGWELFQEGKLLPT